MSPLIIYNGKLLGVGNALAADLNCCCGIILCIDPWYVGVFIDASPPFCELETTEIARKYCIDCGETTTEYTPPSFASNVIRDCQNICQAQPLVSYNHWTEFYNRGDTSIDFRGYAQLTFYSFSVNVDANLINTDYPASSGWIIIYTEDLLLNETYINTDNCEDQRVCEKWGYQMSMFAIKDCTSDDPGLVIDITEEAFLSDNTFCADLSSGGPYEDCPDCPSPPIIIPTGYCVEECPGGASGGGPDDGFPS